MTLPQELADGEAPGHRGWAAGLQVEQLPSPCNLTTPVLPMHAWQKPQRRHFLVLLCISFITSEFELFVDLVRKYKANIIYRLLSMSQAPYVSQLS